MSFFRPVRSKQKTRAKILKLEEGMKEIPIEADN